MSQKIALEDTPPKIAGDLHMPMVLFILSATAAIGAAILRLILQPPN